MSRPEMCLHILLGIPEDIGPRANLGKSGSHKGWGAFLKKFCSLLIWLMNVNRVTYI